MRSALFSSFVWLLIPIVSTADAPPADKAKEIAGKSEFLRSVPKHFATLQAVDAARHQVTLLLEGETAARPWPVAPDAEVKSFGWWGRLDQFRVGDRVWVWMQLDRNKKPVAVAMLADELSEQDMHGSKISIEATTPSQVTLTWPKSQSRSLKVEDQTQVFLGKTRASADQLKIGQQVFVQSAGDQARLILDPAGLEARREQQKALLQERWLKDGLPGTVIFRHVFSGELEFMLDHEAMRWTRSLKPGEEVTLLAEPPIKAVVKLVRPWRERTQVRLVTAALEQADLVPGQRLGLRMTAPPEEAAQAQLPPDLDHPRSRAERIEWFLASIYCTCKVKGDGCTGHFYTLASCNPNACGMPTAMRKQLANLIDKGMNDRQVFEELLKLHGPDLLRPHLLP
jgi:hypothetical protein